MRAASRSALHSVTLRRATIAAFSPYKSIITRAKKASFALRSIPAQQRRSDKVSIVWLGNITGPQAASIRGAPFEPQFQPIASQSAYEPEPASTGTPMSPTPRMMLHIQVS
jgi:hypothetical protein